MDDHVFEVLDVSAWEVIRGEPAGDDDDKVWLVDPRAERDDYQLSRWLFKPVTRHDGWEQGEDWSEFVAARLAEVLDVPAAVVRLATRRGRRRAAG